MDQIKLGEKIKDARLAKGLTQRDLGAKLGLSMQAISKWEHGMNAPDISTLKELCDILEIDIAVLLGAESPTKTKKNNKKYIWLGLFGALILIFIVVELIIHFKNDEFEFKKLTTTCDNFNIIGSIAYNLDKTSLYISDVTYCGEENNTKYQKIECNLYEKHDDNIILVSTCDIAGQNTTLQAYLEKIKINVDNYTSSCKLFKTSDLYLEISAYIEEDIITTYKIPLNFEDNC